MPDITLKNLPPDVYEQIRQAATQHHRSLNNEILICLENRFSTSQQQKQATILAKARALREKTKGHLVTNEELLQAKYEGRL